MKKARTKQFGGCASLTDHNQTQCLKTCEDQGFTAKECRAACNCKRGVGPSCLTNPKVRTITAFRTCLRTGCANCEAQIAARRRKK